MKNGLKRQDQLTIDHTTNQTENANIHNIHMFPLSPPPLFSPSMSYYSELLLTALYQALTHIYAVLRIFTVFTLFNKIEL